jgi:hypothetical protein
LLEDNRWVQLSKGTSRINTFSWDAFHEAWDLQGKAEANKKIHGHYPALAEGKGNQDHGTATGT